jgi:hypothetical protein
LFFVELLQHRTPVRRTSSSNFFFRRICAFLAARERSGPCRAVCL